MKIEKDVSLAQFSTLRVGGPADFFVRVKSKEDLSEALKFAHDNKHEVFIFGGGSNILFSDEGFRGIVIKNEISGIDFAESIVKVGAGERLANLVTAAAKNSLSGLEDLAGVPGTVGGAVVGNSNEIGERVKQVTIFKNGETKTLEKEQLEFSYRDSNLRDKVLIEVEFELQKSSENLVAKIATLAREKVAKQPFDGTAGSWFKNPSSSRTARLLRTSPKSKSAWELIDEAGCRGLKVGGAVVSEKHANFFQNVGDATAADFLELEKMVVERVREKFGVELEREVVVV